MYMFGFDDYPLDITYTHRKKTASIQIIGDRIKVILPQGMSDKEIKDLLENRRKWIENNWNKQKNATIPHPKCYRTGEHFLYLGTSYSLRLQEEKRKPVVQLNENYMDVFGQKDQRKIEKELTRWYRQKALLLQERSFHFSPLVGVIAQSVKIRSYKARWGCCSTQGDITYNWRLICAPLDIIDYVVVHELCHILEQNHSSCFWAEVGRVLPHYKELRQWLKINGKYLFI